VRQIHPAPSQNSLLCVSVQSLPYYGNHDLVPPASKRRRLKAAGGTRDSLSVSPELFDVIDDAILAARPNISESVDCEAPRTTIF
jgi:hypothetical protein